MWHSSPPSSGDRGHRGIQNTAALSLQQNPERSYPDLITAALFNARSATPPATDRLELRSNVPLPAHPPVPAVYLTGLGYRSKQHQASLCEEPCISDSQFTCLGLRFTTPVHLVRSCPKAVGSPLPALGSVETDALKLRRAGAMPREAC
ncbi:hypothetical protein SKAU_G00025020 [Synaphobranchus kaupii]|uniref:Uncharacterized protein n=1 Tax=Synaphobranchus kaupii TaxID=118154 RepID=A0A9Q1GCM0_SYNKA|nr:hypothetical protein SKAU_G00025020 [Synaphobranchus kaupii]